MLNIFKCEQESWWYSCLQFYEFSAVDYVVFTIMLAVSASVGVSSINTDAVETEMIMIRLSITKLP